MPRCPQTALSTPPSIKMEEGVAPPPKTPKKKRKKKEEEESIITAPNGSKKKVKQETITEHMPVRKKRDRFNGMSEDEVMARTLPDHLAPDLDIVIIGINPGLTAAYIGHHYAGPGNHFWKCLFLSGLISEPMNAYDDFKLKDIGIGFTNIVARTTRGSADLKRNEIKEGAKLLLEKLQKYRPKIAVFNGKGIYEVFCGQKNFNFGKQPDMLEGTETMVYVMPSSSARCAQLPRAVDKVPFYVGLKKLRDHCRGLLPQPMESEIVFDTLEMKCKMERMEMLDDDDFTGVDLTSLVPGATREVTAGKGETTPQPKPKKKKGRKSKAAIAKEEGDAAPADPLPGINTEGAPPGFQNFPQGQPFPHLPGSPQNHGMLDAPAQFQQVTQSPFGSMATLQAQHKVQMQQHQQYYQQQQRQYQQQVMQQQQMVQQQNLLQQMQQQRQQQHQQQHLQHQLMQQQQQQHQPDQFQQYGHHLGPHQHQQQQQQQQQQQYAQWQQGVQLGSFQSNYPNAPQQQVTVKREPDKDYTFTQL